MLKKMQKKTPLGVWNSLCIEGYNRVVNRVCNIYKKETL